MIALGVDPGTAATGYGVVATDGIRGSARLIECGVIRTTPSTPLPDRLQIIYEGINQVIARHQASCMAVESVFHSKNARTSLVLGHARGVIILAAKLNGLEIFEYPPAVIKKAITGTGAATKEQIQFMVAKLLRLRRPPSPSDAADGVAAALAHLSGVQLRELLHRGGVAV